MQTLNRSKSVSAQAEIKPPRVLSRIAIDRRTFLVHEFIDRGPGQCPQILVGLTKERGGELRPLNPRKSIGFDIPRLPVYSEAVAKLLARVAAAARGDLSLPAPSFAEQMTGAAFSDARRAGR